MSSYHFAGVITLGWFFEMLRIVGRNKKKKWKYRKKVSTESGRIFRMAGGGKLKNIEKENHR